MFTLLQIVAALAALFYGGEYLVRGASALASRLGVRPLVIGLTVVALGTSAPELVVSLDAALKGASDIAVGNVVGSNIANIALILGVTALIRPVVVDPRVISVHAPLMIGASLLLVFTLRDAVLSRFEGMIALLCLAGYLSVTFVEARRAPETVREELAAATPQSTGSTASTIAFITLGLLLLGLGGRLLVDAAIELALQWNVSRAAIALTVVAVGTSLPELATSTVAALRGQGDIAVGNVVGSNIFNILGILGITATIQPPHPAGIETLDLGIMCALAILLPITLWLRRSLRRIEGALLLTAFVTYANWLLFAP
ncbi:calcium/sodium antiporter [Mangrovimicrobium sediminis]|uniref:Calcium/sodium antiporter n=2 Tax=Mangrovimicrobium sediminis TaxID=2562682 RepID=A0A4Z0LV17_9GAMM|nr:calcium/sodium antiporter [Haliea sp. SAOS-164]